MLVTGTTSSYYKRVVRLIDIAAAESEREKAGWLKCLEKIELCQRASRIERSTEC